MARRARPSVRTPATAELTAAGVAFTVHPYAHSEGASSYGLEAAAELGVEPARVFKTLVVDVDGTLAVAVVPVSGRLDLKAVAAALGARRAVMADPVAAERSSGYVVGGISPFGQRRRLVAVLDASALELPTIYVSAGRRGVDLALAPADLVSVLDARTARIARG
jgi:Cys-tRNA(Pro)/Cys-tRNA(Cys) deacylase